MGRDGLDGSRAQQNALDERDQRDNGGIGEAARRRNNQCESRRLVLLEHDESTHQQGSDEGRGAVMEASAPPDVPDQEAARRDRNRRQTEPDRRQDGVREVETIGQSQQGVIDRRIILDQDPGRNGAENAGPNERRDGRSVDGRCGGIFSRHFRRDTQSIVG